MSGEEATADTKRPEDETQKDQTLSDSKESSAEDSGQVGLLDQPLIVEGKRKRKSVESFQASTSTPAKKKRLSLQEGQGVKLSELNLELGNRQADELRPLYKLLFNTPGQKRNIKRDIGDFSGFTFEKDDPELGRRRAGLAKFQKQGLVTNFCRPLGLSTGGSKEEVMDRILDFLLKPTSKEPAQKVTPKSAGKKRSRKSKASPEKDDEQEQAEEEDTKEDGHEGGKEEGEAMEEKHEESAEKEGMDEQEDETGKEEEVVKQQEEAVEKQEEMGVKEAETEEKQGEVEEKEEENTEKEGMGKQEVAENKTEVSKEQEEIGVKAGDEGEKQEGMAEDEKVEDTQGSGEVTEDPPVCEKKAPEVMEGAQGDNDVASGEVPSTCEQEMDTTAPPPSDEAAKKVPSAVEQDNEQALEQVKAED